MRSLFGFGGAIIGLILLARLEIIPAQYRTLYESNYLKLIIFLAFIGTVIMIRGIFKQIKEHQQIGIKLIAINDLVNSEILENGVKPFLRLFINNQKQTSLETRLIEKNAPGLWAIMNATYEVPTETKRKVERLISSLSGGSIGVAGPRGVGKSTLLTAICHPQRREFQNQPALTILTSVPVKYDSKEFVLHLYSQICKKVIQLETNNRPQQMKNLMKSAQKRISLGFQQMFHSYRQLFLFILIASSIGLAVAYSVSFGNILGEYREVIHNISRILFFVSILYFLISFESTFILRELTRTKRDEEGDLSEQITNEAEKRLDEINFQMSFSEGWSGGLKLPESIQFIESSADFRNTKTRNKLILPEIIHDYRYFISLISQKYKILIGIDELDKITKTEVAQQFLNETKAIFGIQNCFYLVSISDNALSNFEKKRYCF